MHLVPLILQKKILLATSTSLQPPVQLPVHGVQQQAVMFYFSQ